MSYIPTKQKIQEYIPVSNSFVPDGFQSFIRQAEQKFIHKYVSKAQYDAIITAAANDDITDQVYRAVISFAYYLYIPFANVAMSNAGITQTRSENQIAAKPEAVEDLRQACYFAAWEELEAILLAFETAPDTYAIWRNSKAKTIADELLFTNASDFNSYLNIREMRRVFVLLLPSIRRTQNTYIRNVLGKDLLTDVLANRTTPENKTLINDYIKPAIAQLAMADSIPNMSVELGSYDMVLMFDNGGANKQKSSGKMLPQSIIQLLIDSYTKKGKSLICDLTKFLVDNPEDYPLYGALPEPDPETLLTGLYGENNVIGFF
jgi:hypothetical protein